ncbi:hypothetical protein ACSQ6I_23480 [Anabaena sp. WFMT]|uniref:hypothetical protein n=1 Tax=Anabaena sp. WFMT TaxID=3449730 RepID=UPI003F223B2C
MKKRLGRHQPNKFLLYKDIHNSALKNLCDTSFVGSHSLVFESIPGEFCLSGEISCLGNILVAVYKILTILDDDEENPLVQTVEYSYNASIQGHNTIFRYDNQDDYHHVSYDDHQDEHHKHEYDWTTGKQNSGSPMWIGDEKSPTLGDVLWELHNWYYENISYLKSPYSYAQLGKGRFSIPTQEL